MTSQAGSSTFDARSFRRALGNFATGVTVITARDDNGTVAGMTASSFNSVSLNPPLILWSCIKESRSCAVFESASHFAVNILASDQVHLSNQFASQQDDKFAGIDLEEGFGGAPLLPSCAGRFQCERYDKVEGGDHWIFIGKVVAFDDFSRPPLCFHQGAYSVVVSHPDTASKDEAAQAPGDQPAGRLRDHTFYLMLMAIREYQSSYRPKMAALGLSVIESRVLLVLDDHPDIDADELSSRTSSPVVEVSEALAALKELGMIARSPNGYTTSPRGKAKADQCWELADAHAKEAFANLSEAEMATFKEVLRGMIDK